MGAPAVQPGAQLPHDIQTRIRDTLARPHETGCQDMSSTQREQHARSLAEPEAFWAEQAALLDWHRTPAVILDRSHSPFDRWYPDGQLNACHNALDRHIAAGHGDRCALIYDSPVTGSVKRFSYAELQREVALLAGVLLSLGVSKGDRVLVYMPMVPEAVMAMLACARIGAIHSVVFGGFAAHELAVRIDDATPTVVLTASCGIEPTRVVAYKPLLDAAIDLATHRPRHCLVLQRPQLGHVGLGEREALAGVVPAAMFAHMASQVARGMHRRIQHHGATAPLASRTGGIEAAQ